MAGYVRRGEMWGGGSDTAASSSCPLQPALALMTPGDCRNCCSCQNPALAADIVSSF